MKQLLQKQEQQQQITCGKCECTTRIMCRLCDFVCQVSKYSYAEKRDKRCSIKKYQQKYKNYQIQFAHKKHFQYYVLHVRKTGKHTHAHIYVYGKPSYFCVVGVQHSRRQVSIGAVSAAVAVIFSVVKSNCSWIS